MPSTQEKKKLFERDCLDLGGAGGEPLGEPPATPPSLRQGRAGSSEQLVEAVLGRRRSGAAVEQRRLKTTIADLPESERRRLAEAVLDQLAEDDELGEQVSERLLDQTIGGLIAGKRGEAEILGSDGVLGELTRRVLERALGEELAEHLGYPAGQAPPGGVGNSRNGGTPKTLLVDYVARHIIGQYLLRDSAGHQPGPERGLQAKHVLAGAPPPPDQQAE